jgi:spermidine synthase
MYVRRPHPEHLTQFYLAMSFGGVLGGLFCALLAPLLFNWTYEHPILIVAAAWLVAPKALFGISKRLWGTHASALLAVSTLLLALLISSLSVSGIAPGSMTLVKAGAAVAISLIAVLAFGHRLLFSGTLVALMLCLGGWEKLSLSLHDGRMVRSYFGVYSIRTNGTTSRTLVHGTTIHGVQNLGPGQDIQPITYYAPRSGIGLAMAAAPALFGPTARIGIVGLGAGTLACYAKPGQRWRFYEIDPAIVKIASDAKRFTYLSKCLPNPSIRLGDARITLASEPQNSADLLAIDAFSSDAVPMHLLTREAFATYQRHIASKGLLMVHISNRFLDLEPVLSAAAKEGWFTSVRNYTATVEERKRNITPSLWVAFSPSKSTIDQLVASNPEEEWRPLAGRASFNAWTDDFASILTILKPYNRDK